MADFTRSESDRTSTKVNGTFGVFGRAWYLVRRYPVLPVSVLSLLIASAVFAPLIAPYDPIRDAEFRNVRQSPLGIGDGSAKHLLGTDQIGRDVLSRVVYGGRMSLMVASVAISSGVVIGTVLGLISGYAGGHTDEVIMRIVDMWIALPFIMVALVIAIVLGQSVPVMFMMLALIAWVSFVRPVRGEVLSLKQREYVDAARVAGASKVRILFRHILPGVLNTVVVIATLNAGGLVLTESVLSFLGVGIPAPTPTWGGMVADGRSHLDTAWWISTFPGFAIFLLVLSLNFLGDWFRDEWDPKLKQLV